MVMRPRSADREIFEEIFIREDYAFEVTHLVKVVMDLGANVGYGAIYFARRFPEARIIAVEPSPANFSILVLNTQAYPNIIPVQAAVWSHACTLRFENEQAGHSDYRVGEAPDASSPSSIRAVTVQELMDQHGVSRIDLLKIDIEGTEKELFAASSDTGWLAKTRLLVIETHDRFLPGCSSTVRNALAPYQPRHVNLGLNDVYYLSSA